jgi:CHAT domain-containing protein
MKFKSLVILLLASHFSFGFLVPKEKKIAIAVDKYQHGYYEEAILILKSIPGIFYSQNPISASDAYSVRAASHFRLANYELFKADIFNWSDLINLQTSDSVKFICCFKIAQLYLEVGNIKACDSILTKIYFPGFKPDLEYFKVKLLIEQGRLLEADKLINEILPVRKRDMGAVNKTKYKNYFTYFDSPEKLFSGLVFSKIKTYILKGQSDSAYSQIALHKEWLDKNLPEDLHKRELEILSGDLEVSRNNIYKAYDYYKRAYDYNNFQDLDFKKIMLLSEVIVLSNKTGYTDQSQKMLRRLQMFSFIYAGKHEPFHFAYELTLCKMYLDMHQFSKAAERLRKFTSYSSLPPWHPVRSDFAKIESVLWIYNPQVNVSSNFDSLISLLETNLYPSHDFIAHLLLEKINFEINFGSSIKKSEPDLLKFNKVFISNGYGGEFFLRYYYLSSSYYFLMDDFKTCAGYSEKANEYALKFYQTDSERKLHYEAVYVKRLFESGSYKEFYIQYAQFRKHLSDIKWSDIDEKRKCYMTLSDILKLMGEKDETEVSLINILSEIEESGRENIYDQANIESYVAYNYFQTGNLSRAENLLKESTDEKKSLLKDNSVSFIENIFFRSELELAKGNYSESDKNLEQASGIISNGYGINSLSYGEYLKQKADYYIAIADYKRANDFIDKSLKIVSGKLGKNDLKNVELIIRKAYILSQNDQKQLEKANILALYNESLSILSNTIGNENLFCMDVLKKYAQYHILINNLDKADSLLTVAEKYWKKKFGNESKELLEIYLLKGDMSYKKGDYSKANSYYQNVKDITASVYDKNNSNYIAAFARQAKVDFMQNKANDAMNIMEELLPKYLNSVSKNFSSLSFREKSKYWSSIKDEFEFYVFLVLSNKERTGKYSKNVYNNIIATKAILLSNSIKIRENIMSSGDSALILLYKDWVDLKEYFISVSTLTKSELEEQKIDLTSLELDIERKEKLLSRKSELFKNEEMISRAQMKDIAAILPENEYAIELVRYRTFYKEFTDTVNYAALIITNGYLNPEVVLFKNGNQLESKYLKYVRNAARHHIKDEISYNIFWAPIQHKIPDNATVYLSAEGAYNQFNIEMLTDSAGKYMLDRIQLVQVTNTKELLRSVYRQEKQKKEITSSNVVLCGSPEFYTEANPNPQYTLSKLPGAAKEISDLAALFTANNIMVTQKMYKDLTESWVKGLRSPKVFHIATHGYYSEGNGDENNAMLNSGLLLTGAGDILDEGANVNSRDGILTAYKAMNLNFDNTELVVLSACETGLGEIQAGEGVYGLQRSFLIAGSKAIIVSLYKVNDEVTQKLMNEFYSNWLKTADIRSSFVLAKQKIKQEYPDIPVYWGAFILIEGQPKLDKKAKMLAH